MFALFEAVNKLRKRQIEIELLPDALMGRAQAFLSSDRKRLCLRHGLVDRALAGDRDAIFDIAHELAHIILHGEHGPALPRLVGGNEKSRGLPQEESAEHQANYFARVLLMDADEVRRYQDAEMLSDNCNVPLTHAALRLREFTSLAPKPFQLPPIVELAWNAARLSTEPTHNATTHRLSRAGLVVERCGFERPAHKFGWFEDYGSVVSYQEDRSS